MVLRDTHDRLWADHARIRGYKVAPPARILVLAVQFNSSSGKSPGVPPPGAGVRLPAHFPSPPSRRPSSAPDGRRRGAQTQTEQNLQNVIPGAGVDGMGEEDEGDPEEMELKKIKGKCQFGQACPDSPAPSADRPGGQSTERRLGLWTVCGQPKGVPQILRSHYLEKGHRSVC